MTRRAGSAPAAPPSGAEAPSLERVRALAFAALLDYARRRDPAHALSMLLRALAAATDAPCTLAPQLPQAATPLRPLSARPPGVGPTAPTPAAAWPCTHSGTRIGELQVATPAGLSHDAWSERLAPALDAAAALLAGLAEHAGHAVPGSLALIRTAIHEAGTYVWEWDIGTDLLGDIDEGERMLGYPPNTIGPTQADWDRIVHPDDLALIERAYEAHATGGSPMYQVIYRARAADGEWRWVEERGRVVEWDRRGRPRRMFGTQTDATLLRQLEQAQSERVEAQAANHAKTMFLSRVSHELRTPLNAVLGFAHLLDTDPQLAPLEAQRQQLRLIREAGEHLSTMIGDLLDLSLAEASHLPVHTQPVPLAGLLEACANWVRPQAESARVALRMQPLDEAATVRADPTRLRQIVTNLLSNAIKYNRSGGRVTLRAQAAGAEWLIEVEDTGFGLTASERQRLFEPLNRLGREHSDIAGTGLGLALSHSLAQLMGGRIGVSSVPGHGSTFSVALPAA